MGAKKRKRQWAQGEGLTVQVGERDQDSLISALPLTIAEAVHLANPWHDCDETRELKAMMAKGG